MLVVSCAAVAVLRCARVSFRPTTLSEWQWQQSGSHTWMLKDSPLLPRPRAAAASSSRPVAGVEGAVLLDDVLSPSERAGLIALAEELGYEAGVGPEAGVREAGQCVVIVPQAAVEELAGRLAHSAPRILGSIRVNRRFRFYRYESPHSSGGGATQRFWPHIDGAHCECRIESSSEHDEQVLVESSPRQRSAFSLLLYLNDDFRGGETRFFTEREPGAEQCAAARTAYASHEEEAVGVAVVPRAGAALAFRHGSHPLSPLHEGAPLRSTATRSSKYIIRTDCFLMADSG